MITHTHLFADSTQVKIGTSQSSYQPRCLTEAVDEVAEVTEVVSEVVVGEEVVVVVDEEVMAGAKTFAFSSMCLP